MIEAVIDLESEEESHVKGKNVDRVDQDLVKAARERRSQSGESWYPVRVFLLSDFHPTNFVKSSPGGMQGSKQYFDISKLKVIDVADLARKLQDKNWENYD